MEGFSPEVLWVTKAGSETLKRPLALRPTSETAFYQMYQLWVSTAKDLPYKLYQSCSVFRNESETNPFMRGVEFLWIETHDLFASKEAALAQTKEDGEIMRRVATDQMGIAFMQFKRPKWDTFAGADSTFAYDCLLPDGKVLQFGSTHYLEQHFTKAFEVSYLTADGKHEHPHSTCFGPGVWRMMAATVSVHGDNKGLIFPYAVAPLQVVIIPILRGKEGNEATLAYAQETAKMLKKAGIRVMLDDSDKNPGFKYNYWEVKGVPLRIEIGGREAAEQTLTIVRRTDRNKTLVKRSQAVEKIEQEAAVVLTVLLERSKTALEGKIEKADSKEAVLKVLEAKGIAKTHLCSMEMDGKPCAESLKDFTKGGKVRGIRLDEHEKASAGKCIVCGKPSKQVCYVARQY